MEQKVRKAAADIWFKKKNKKVEKPNVKVSRDYLYTTTNNNNFETVIDIPKITFRQTREYIHTCMCVYKTEKNRFCFLLNIN